MTGKKKKKKEEEKVCTESVRERSVSARENRVLVLELRADFENSTGHVTDLPRCIRTVPSHGLYWYSSELRYYALVPSGPKNSVPRSVAFSECDHCPMSGLPWCPW
eukprot:3469998-Rhodomonas_salina.1